MKNGGALVVLGVVVAGLLFWWILASSAGASGVAAAALAPVNESGISGTARFVGAGDGQSTAVTVTLSGLEPQVAYGVTINNGSCQGPALFILNPVIGDASGNGSASSTVPAQPASYWFVAVHASASPDAALVACGAVNVTGAGGGSCASPCYRVPVRNQPLQLPNGGGAPPRTPLPTPGR
jgi:hypothetical protein